MMQCITVPDVGYMAVWGVSNNTRSYWDNTGAEKLGFEPTQNSEAFAAEILEEAEPARPDRTAISGWRLRHPRLHAPRCTASENVGLTRPPHG